MIPPPVPAVCPQCRAALPPGAPHGLCPACLMDAGGTDSDSGIPADPFAAPLDLDTLRRAFPQLDILAPIGAGGMGRVYKVRQPNLDRIVALKVLPPELARNPAWVERFTREARALARLNHPHIVQVYDVGQTSAGPDVPVLCWLVMEYVDGVTLRQVQRTGGLSTREALALIPRLCDALQYAHEKGVLHRDIKPENILLDAAGAVKIADFGLAKLGGANSPYTLTQAGARLGTAAYMAPEQIESPQDVDHRADIYSLGVVFYELLTGGLPLGRFPAPSEKSGTDPRLDHIVFRTLEKERDRRFQAAGEVRTALDEVRLHPPPPPQLPSSPLPHGAPVPPQPRDPKTPPYSAASPPPPPGTPVRVGFNDRDRLFPGSGAVLESAGYGCGWLVFAPIRLILVVLTMFIPIWAQEGFKSFDRVDGAESYADWAVWIAALTGMAAFWCARPLMKAFGWPLKPHVKRLRPLLMLLAFGLWGLTLTWVAREARSWPSRGSLMQLTFTCDRPPLTEPGLNGNQDLNKGFEDETRSAFKWNENAVIEGPDAGSLQNRGGYDVRKAAHPLRKEWTLTAAGESPAAVSDRLLRVCQGMISRLPNDLKNSASFEIRHFNVTRMGTHFNISTSDIGVLTGALMALAGLLAALCHGKSRAGHLMVAVPGVMAGALLIPMDNWVNSLGGITPAANELGSDMKPTMAALKPLASQKENKSEYDACYRWIDACLRLDKAVADSLAGRNLSASDWKTKAAFWLDNHLVSVLPQTESSGTQPGKDLASFSCLVFAKGPGPESYRMTPRDYGSYFTSQTQAYRLILTLTKKGDIWVVSQ